MGPPAAPTLLRCSPRPVLCRARTEIPIGDTFPAVTNTTYVAPSASLVGDVNVGDACYIGYGAVLRGDEAAVNVHLKSRIGDGAVLATAKSVATGLNAETFVGNYSTVGAGCVLRSATLDGFCVVGDNSVLGEGSIMEECSELEAGSVLPAGHRVPAGEVYGGNPATFVRMLSKTEAFERRTAAQEAYTMITTAHRDEFLPVGSEWKDAEARREALAKLLASKDPALAA